jgi:DNA-binding CsgD family transcriptional regulator
MLRARGNAVGFRHEIARGAVEDALSPHRRVALHRAALAALSGRADPARLAHHAEAAEQDAAVLEHAMAAGERAARLGAHREAAAQLARALRHAGAMAPAERAALLERRSYECYLTERIPEAIEARELALGAHRAAGDRLREGDAERWLSRLAWFTGDNARAERSGLRAVALLETLPVGRELAMAWSNLAQLRMLAHDHAGAAELGERAIVLAERLGETEILAHALNNVGSAEICNGRPEGREKLARSLALALDAGLEEHVARAYTNLATTAIERRDFATATPDLDAGIAYCEEHDLSSWHGYMSGWKARAELQQGRWDAAAQIATAVTDQPRASAPSRITALVVIGTLRARRGDPGAWAPLDEALALATQTGELQRLAPVAAARAEALWLAGEDERIAGETGAVLERAIALQDAWASGELRVWRRRGGVEEPPAAGPVPAPYARELEGDAAAAARAWVQIGCPYEAALALAGGDDEAGLRASLAELQRLGARTAATRVARRLRERGARDVRRGPRASTQTNPAGLTARQLEVLGLLAQGERNADIAARLFLSEKTVDHHVSAILGKLGVRTRGQAAAAAARLGITAT